MAVNNHNFQIKNLTAYRGGKKIIDGVSLSLSPFAVTALIGKNGCGKSTLISCINSTLHYNGKITFDGQNLLNLKNNERARLLSVLPQALPRPHISVYELAMFGRNPYIGIGKRPSVGDINAVNLALDLIGIQNLSNKHLDEISGGECQKAYLAMTVCQDTEILVLDEPTTHMDIRCADEFLALLCGLKAKTVLTVLHDLNLAVKYAQKLAVIDDGKLVFHGDTADAVSCGIIESTFGVKKYTCGSQVFFTP